MNKFETPSTLEPEKQSKPEKKELPKNVVEVETDNAVYRIAYTTNKEVTNSEVIKDCDAVLLEGFTEYTPKGIAKTVDQGSISREPKMLPKYKEIIQEAAEKQKPMFFFDISSKFFEDEKLAGELAFKRHLLQNLETITGIALLAYSGNNLRKPDITRREFIKNAALLFGGTYLTFPGAADLLLKDAEKNPDEKSLKRKTEKKVDKIRAAIHPETYPEVFLGGRNYLTVQKAETIAKILGKELSRKPNLSLVTGSSHHEIEDIFQEKEDQRITRLKYDFEDNLEKESFIARIDFYEEGSIMPKPSDPKLHFNGKKYIAKISIFSDPSFQK